MQTAGVFEHLWHPDPDASAGGTDPDLAPEGTGQGKKKKKNAHITYSSICEPIG